MTDKHSAREQILTAASSLVATDDAFNRGPKEILDAAVPLLAQLFSLRAEWAICAMAIDGKTLKEIHARIQAMVEETTNDLERLFPD